MRIAIQGQPWQKISKVPFQPMACICPHATWGDTNRRTEVQVDLGKNGDLISKTKAGRTLGSSGKASA
jgi:hypothetical protein